MVIIYREQSEGHWPTQSLLLSARRNPLWHWQLYEPTVLLHRPSQPPLLVAHSFTSESTHRQIQFFGWNDDALQEEDSLLRKW